jgi:phasin
MDNNRKTNKVGEEVRRTADRVTDQSTQAFERTAAAANEAAESIRDCCSKAVKGAQDYHNRALEFTQTNANRSFEFAQKLLGVKSPSEFFEVSTDHTRRQWEVIADQAKQLTELAQKTTLAATEPLRTGFESAFKRAA